MNKSAAVVLCLVLIVQLLLDGCFVVMILSLRKALLQSIAFSKETARIANERAELLDSLLELNKDVDKKSEK